MKSENNKRPEALVVERRGETAELIFSENVREETREGETFYTYEEYRLTVPWRENLEESAEGNREAWLAKAREEENREPELTKEERIAQLEEENRRLREESELTAQALEELIGSVLGGE